MPTERFGVSATRSDSPTARLHHHLMAAEIKKSNKRAETCLVPAEAPSPNLEPSGEVLRAGAAGSGGATATASLPRNCRVWACSVSQVSCHHS